MSKRCTKLGGVVSLVLHSHGNVPNITTLKPTAETIPVNSQCSSALTGNEIKSWVLASAIVGTCTAERWLCMTKGSVRFEQQRP